MLIRRFKPNRKDPVELVYVDGTKLLMSYEAPIAAFIPGRGYLVTDLDLTKTGKERIAEWLTFHPGESVERVPQDEIYKIITGRRIWTLDDKVPDTDG